MMFLKVRYSRKAEIREKDLSDELLVSQYLSSGNKDLIAILFERYTHLVYGICLHYLHDPDQCKDAVMDIFSSLFDKLAVNPISSFKNWLYSVSRNHCLMLLRKGACHQRSLEKMASRAIPDMNDVPVTFFEKGENPDERLIQRAIDSLNSEQRLCVRLMYLEDKSYKDIVDLTGYTFSQVKSHIQNGKRNLKNYLRNQHDFIGP